MARTLTGRGALTPRTVHGNVWATALRAGLSVTLALGALYALGRVDLIPYAAMGCFTALYARDETYARRRRLLAVVGAALTASVAAGALTQVLLAHTLAAVVTGALVAGGAKYLADALAFGPPGGLMFVFAAGVAAYNPLEAAQVPLVVATTAGAAALSWSLAQVGALAWAHAPERLATARALHAVARHLRAPGPATTDGAEEALETAWSTLLSAREPGPLHRDLELLTARAEDLFTGAHSDLERARAGAELGEMARRARREVRPQPALSSGEHRTFTDRAHRMRTHHPVPAMGRALRRAWRRPSPTRVSVVRIVVASLVAGAAAWALGMGHGYWAAVSAGSVLQATNVTTTWHRTLQRAAGTVAGVVLAAALFWTDYSVLGTIALVVVLQMAAELVVGTNYSYAIVFVTPLTLALSSLAHPAAAAQDLAGERLWATVLGALVGLVVCALLPNRTAAEHLEQARAECEVCCARFAQGQGPHQRRRLGRSVVALARARDLARGEFGVCPGHLERAGATLERARCLAGPARGTGDAQHAGHP
ncbi:FUSC family protein [Nocardiopsis salina]|uniref:FUSC family protein n=1 Tax=Nocardiopsis salina TaxID=245836 RepID=UPI00034A5C06|nr:FUSC family protein [Nocardiopsis salina]